MSTGLYQNPDTLPSSLTKMDSRPPTRRKVALAPTPARSCTQRTQSHIKARLADNCPENMVVHGQALCAKSTSTSLPSLSATVPAGGGESALERGIVYYQSDDVVTSIRSTGTIYAVRDGLGSDSEFVGANPLRTEIDVQNGRGVSLNLDDNGFCMVPDKREHIDYYNNDEILQKYYSQCEQIVKEATGAPHVFVFDHNMRAKNRKMAGEMLQGGSAIQEPLISYGVHNDYTVTSAERRMRLLSQPPCENDTVRLGGDAKAPLNAENVERLLKGRYMFVNVWRNVLDTPVRQKPLALVDAKTMSLSDLAVFEIRYADRVGENYLSLKSEAHRWYYFPEITRDEAILIKQWDSRGAQFLDTESQMGAPSAPGGGPPASVPATFSLHTGFDLVDTPPDAPDRESLEVRCIAFWENP